MGEQPGSSARVLGGDQGHFPEDSQRAEADVFEIADGRRDDVKSAGHGSSDASGRVGAEGLLYHREMRAHERTEPSADI